MPKSSVTLIRSCLVFTVCNLVLIPSFGFGGSAEGFFKDARGYTVKIRSSISTPFPGDDKGTFTGAGFVVDRQRGWIATNAHVVSRSNSSIQVSSLKFEYEPAQAVYVDPVFDIAIIQSKSIGALKEAKLDCQMNFSVGAPVGAFGHPWGTDYTGTKGIVSTTTSDIGIFGEYIQTDAPINPGNSGGPLINLNNGDILGMNTAGKDKAQNMNYAVTAEQICDVLALMRKQQDPTPPKLGLSFFKNTDNKNTLRIAKVTSKTNSFGFEVGDTILGIEGEERVFTTEPQLLNKLRKYPNGVALRIQRNKKVLALKGQFEPMPSIIGRQGLFFSGIMVRENDDTELQALFASKSNLSIGYVESGSLGDNRNFGSNDLVELVNGKEVADLQALNLILQKAANTKEKVVMRLKRPSFEQGRVFSYLEREIEVRNLELVVVAQPTQEERVIRITAQQPPAP